MKQQIELIGDNDLVDGQWYMLLIGVNLWCSGQYNAHWKGFETYYKGYTQLPLKKVLAAYTMPVTV